MTEPKQKRDQLHAFKSDRARENKRDKEMYIYLLKCPSRDDLKTNLVFLIVFFLIHFLFVSLCQESYSFFYLFISALQSLVYSDISHYISDDELFFITHSNKEWVIKKSFFPSPSSLEFSELIKRVMIVNSEFLQEKFENIKRRRKHFSFVHYADRFFYVCCILAIAWLD